VSAIVSLLIYETAGQPDLPKAMRLRRINDVLFAFASGRNLELTAVFNEEGPRKRWAEWNAGWGNDNWDKGGTLRNYR
jgi:hypothetical protein